MMPGGKYELAVCFVELAFGKNKANCFYPFLSAPPGVLQTSQLQPALCIYRLERNRSRNGGDWLVMIHS